MLLIKLKRSNFKECDKYMLWDYNPNFQNLILNRYTLWGKKKSPLEFENFQNNKIIPKTEKLSSFLTLNNHLLIGKNEIITIDNKILWGTHWYLSFGWIGLQESFISPKWASHEGKEQMAIALISNDLQIHQTIFVVDVALE